MVMMFYCSPGLPSTESNMLSDISIGTTLCDSNPSQNNQLTATGGMLGLQITEHPTPAPCYDSIALIQPRSQQKPNTIPVTLELHQRLKSPNKIPILRRLQKILDEEEPAEMIQVLGPKPALKEGNPEEDLTADQTNAQAAALYKVSDATGQMNLTKVADSSPFALNLLIPDDCFVLDNGLCGKIYIWKGRKANEKERQAAEDFISRLRYAPNTQVEILPQGRESPIFKQFFKNWK
ncbi:macrophage-capping protein-like [Molossus molossus]|nr:macrophage-capping protein-like [Molossus molossus]